MDLYIVLGLQPTATDTDIKRAYRRLARRFHPDINPGDRTAEARFRQVLEAYETLIDRERRTRYDAGQQPADAAPARSRGFEGFDFSTRGVDYSASFGDLFAEVLLERESRPPQGERGTDRHHEVTVSFKDAFVGGEVPLTISRNEVCAPCGGRGVTHSAPAACAMCHGSGAVRTVRGHMVFSRTCTACGGTGRQRPRGCRTCHGTGLALRTESLVARIPPGVADGELVRLPNKGDAGVRGGGSGDLYLRVRVDADPVFTRQGDDLHVTVPVAVHEAALGARLELDGLDGTVRVRIPPGTQSGQRFRLRERGAPSTRTGARGDLIVEARLMLPAVLDERSKELLREFGRLNGGLRSATRDGGKA